MNNTGDDYCNHDEGDKAFGNDGADAPDQTPHPRVERAAPLFMEQMLNQERPQEYTAKRAGDDRDAEKPCSDHSPQDAPGHGTYGGGVGGAELLCPDDRKDKFKQFPEYIKQK